MTFVDGARNAETGHRHRTVCSSLFKKVAFITRPNVFSERLLWRGAGGTLYHSLQPLSAHE